VLLAVAVGATLIASQAFAQNRPSAPRPQRASRTTRSGRGGIRPEVTTDTRLAYIITGDTEVDNVSRSGLAGLTLFLAQRTALETGEPVGLDPAR